MTAPKRLRILGTRGVPAAHGGFETFAEHLALYLVKHRWVVTVYCQEDGTGPVVEDIWQGVRRVRMPVANTGVTGTIVFDWKSTLHAARENDLILTLGYNTAVFCAVYRLKGLRNVINMDGIEWRRQKWGSAAKAWFWFNDWAGCLLGNHLVADHPEINKHLRTRVTSQKVDTIAYGADTVLAADPSILQRYGLVPNGYAILIARAEPENSIIEVVKAWSRKQRGVRLLVLGKYDQGHSYQAAALAAASLEVIFVGAIYDKVVVQALRFFARFYVHGHQVGGTNPSLVEAMGAGNAILAHDNPYNRWVAGEGGLYFSAETDCASNIDYMLDDANLVYRLKSASRLRHSEHFTWQQILQTYETLLGPWAASAGAGATSVESAPVCRPVRAGPPRIGHEPAPEVPGASAQNASPHGAAGPSVLVLGATGFIGRALVKRLHHDGLSVRVLVRRSLTKSELLALQGVEIVQGDFTDTRVVEAALNGIQHVYHLARGSGRSWDDYLRFDVEPTRRLAALCAQRGIVLFYTSSIAIYDGGRAGEVISESTPACSASMRINAYARAKLTNENLLAQQHRDQKLNVVVFRPGIVIGEGGNPYHPGVGAWPSSALCRLWGGGHQSLPFVLVEDCVDAMVRALRTPGLAGESFNLVGEPCLSGNDYLDALELTAGTRIQRVAMPAWRLFAQSAAKWGYQTLTGDPERGWPSYRYFEGLSNRASYSPALAKHRLGWRPSADASVLIHKGIAVPVAGLRSDTGGATQRDGTVQPRVVSGTEGAL